MKEFNFFGNIFFINLDSRDDKKERVEKHFFELGIKAERFPAVCTHKRYYGKNFYSGFKNPSLKRYVNSQLGCRISHLNVIKEAKRRGLDNVLIFEDDIYFRNKRYPIDNILVESIKFMSENEWHLFYLGCKCKSRRRHMRNISDHIVCLSQCYQTHAYCVNSSIYDFIIDELESGGRGLEIDVFYTRVIMPLGKTYGCNPVIAKQDRYYMSDIR